MTEHGLCSTDAYHAAEQHVHHRHGEQLLGVLGASQVPGQEGAAATGDARPTGHDGPAALLCAALSLFFLLRHHGGNTPSTRRAVQQSHRGRPELHREAIQVHALGADGTVRVPASGREVIGADDGRAAVDLAPTTDVVGGREVHGVAVFVIGCEPSDTAHFAKGALVQQQRDALSARELAATALSDDPWVVGAGGQPCVCHPLERGDLFQDSSPGLLARSYRCGPPRFALRGRDERYHLPSHHVVPFPQGLNGSHGTGAGRRDGRLHLHRADDQKRIARCDGVTFSQANLDDGARDRALHASLLVVHLEHWRRRPGRRARTRARVRADAARLLLEQGQGVAFGGRREAGAQDLRLLREEGRPRVTGAELGVREDGAQLGQIRRQPGEVKLGERCERSAYRGDEG